MPTQNSDAVAFTRLHVPGKPIILVNVWDAVSAAAVAKLPECVALATPSAGIANATGFDNDDDLTLEGNLGAVKAVVIGAKKHNKPVTVDIQDGYGPKLEECIQAVIQLGAVGVNLEDCDKEAAKMYSIEEAVQRVKRATAAATQAAVPDLHINARCDTLLHGGDVEDAINRGKAYLEAGAQTVFVWGGPGRGTSRQEVVQLCDAFDGRLNVSMRLNPGYLTALDLGKIGVARISIGPQMQAKAMEFVSGEASKILTSGSQTA